MEYLDLVQLADVADIGFVLLVVAACMRALLGEPTRRPEQDSARYEELMHVESMLRELVAEAGAASSNLDRQLFNRKRELEALLEKLESAETGLLHDQPIQAPKAAPQKPPAAAPRRAQTVREDLPNASWAAEQSYQEEQDFELGDLLAEAEDRVSFSNEAAEEDHDIPLLNQIEITNEQAPAAGGQGGEVHSLLSQLDPIAVKVAKRLIADGQEIHRIARKLDLPIAQVRVLDRLLRSETDGVVPEDNESLQRSVNAL